VNAPQLTRIEGSEAGDRASDEDYALAGGWSGAVCGPGGHGASWPGSSPEVQPPARWPRHGPDPAHGGRRRSWPARQAAPPWRARQCSPAAVRPAVPAAAGSAPGGRIHRGRGTPRDIEIFRLIGVGPDDDPGFTPWLLERVADVAYCRLPGRDRESVQRVALFRCRFQARRGALSSATSLDHASCDPPLRANRPRKHAFQVCPAGQLCRCGTPHRGRPPFH
jgi:hypothetical protein